MKKWQRDLLQTERGSFEIFTAGKGEPLCVTHHYSIFNETGDYFADEFTKTHKVILVNLREAGESEKAHEPYQLSLLETIFDLEAVRKAMGQDQWIFAGHSTGGMLGIMYGIYFSSSLKGLVIAGAAARDYFTFSEGCIYHSSHPQFQLMQNFNERLKQPDLSAEERKEISVNRTKLSLYNPEKYEEYFSKSIHKKLSAVRMNFMNRELQVFDVTRKLPLISAPALIMCGRHDVQCPLEYSIEMAGGIRDAELVVFERSNHYPFLEEHEEFHEKLDSFLKRI
ncbi:alpha/beta hydrolase [Rossellomorea vietnamensis]|uniref:Alpha/beta hydrolase n=1 Tax=Rossellomorea vietnamensis TaxID=218284 RepID=A0A5D4MA93_9BACI|nr:alpha/beta hydrolase [Rossellomorea vietnamensis]TYR98839.1 alpha/beta hydrolase [Rossellomorea vietnamensis]